MSDTLKRLQERVHELEGLVQIALSTSQLQAAGIVSLSVFAAAIGRTSRTLKNDLLSKSTLRRLRWPEFKKCAGGEYVTTPEDIRAWMKRTGRSTHFSPKVAAALERANGRRASA